MLRNELRDWDDLRFFLAVYETGSFTRACARLRTDQSTVSRRIAAMEHQLGAKLFDRHGRGMRPTPAARGIAGCAGPIQDAVDTIERRFGGIDGDLTGVVKIAATEGLAAGWLTPQMVEFQLGSPGILIEIQAGNEQADLSRREADIAIRLTAPGEPQLVGQLVGKISFGLYTVQAYEAIFGLPASLDEMFNHRIVDYTALANSQMQAWRDIVGRHERVMYRTNSSVCYQWAVQAGYGIGLFPHYTTKIFPELIPVPITLDMEIPIWLVSHEETNKIARTRTVLDYIQRLFARDRAEWFS